MVDELRTFALGRIGEYAFLPSDQLLVTARGHLVDTRVARPVGRLEPPQVRGQ
jgi:hypothetical protein